MLDKSFQEAKLSDFSTEGLRHFITVLNGQGKQPKTLCRKITTLKNYFGWLHNTGILREDPAHNLVFARVTPPLPVILTRDEATRFIAAAMGNSLEAVLTFLLLGAGLKTRELVNLTTEHIDISDPRRPRVHIEAPERYRNRDMDLPLEFVDACTDFVATYRPELKLFASTERTFNNILQGLARKSGIQWVDREGRIHGKKVNCQILRDSFAVKCLRSGEDIDVVILKLGLALNREAAETKFKYHQLLKLYP